MLFFTEGFIGFDEDVLMQKEWQTVLKFLDCHRKKDPVFEPSADDFTDGMDALELLIQYVLNVCGTVVQNPITGI